MDGELLMMFLTLTLADGALLLLVKAGESGWRGWPVLAGIALGLAALDKTNVLLFAPVAAWWLAGDFSLRWRAWRWKPALLFALGVSLTVLPVTIRNYLVGGDLVLVSSNAGVNLYIGNNPEAQGVFHLPRSSELLNTDLYGSSVRVAEAAAGRPLKPSEVSAFWSERATRFIREHPWDALKLVGWKLLLLLNAREIPNHLDFYLVRAQYAPVLRFMFAGYWMVVPLALLGMAWRLSRGFGAVGRLYVAFLATYALSLLPFFISERYRLPLVPVLIPFAADAMVQLFRMARSREFGRLRTLAFGLAGAAFLVNWPIAERYDFDSFFREVVATKYLEHAVADPARGADDLRQAIVGLKQALEENPGSPVAHLNLGTAYRAIGFTSGAIREWQETLQIDPRSRPALEALQSAMQAYATEGDRVRREEIPTTPFERGEAMLASGHAAEAVKVFEQVIEDEPFNDGAYAEIANELVRRGDDAAAARTLERGLRRHPDSFVLLDGLGVADFDLRHYADARRLWERCLELVPGSEMVKRQLATLPTGN
jgi:tetratricopeptide (TPR) repeat protein